LELRGRKEHLSPSSYKNNKALSKERLLKKGVSFLFANKRENVKVRGKVRKWLVPYRRNGVSESCDIV
jgi:hypothetical protein